MQSLFGLPRSRSRIDSDPRCDPRCLASHRLVHVTDEPCQQSNDRDGASRAHEKRKIMASFYHQFFLSPLVHLFVEFYPRSPDKSYRLRPSTHQTRLDGPAKQPRPTLPPLNKRLGVPRRQRPTRVATAPEIKEVAQQPRQDKGKAQRGDAAVRTRASSPGRAASRVARLLPHPAPAEWLCVLWMRVLIRGGVGRGRWTVPMHAHA